MQSRIPCTQADVISVPCAGPTTFPSWDSRTSLTEFLPSAIACLQEQSKTSGNLAMQRQDLLDELPKTKLGPALESDIAAARFGPLVWYMYDLGTALGVAAWLSCFGIPHTP